MSESAVAQSLQLAVKIKALPEFKPLTAKQRRFLLAYSECGGVRESAKAAGVNWVSHYHWKDRDEAYKQAFDKAKDIYVDAMEHEAFSRATVGVQEPVYQKGELVGYQTKRSDNLLMFSIKGNRPQYRDNFQINQFLGPTSLNVKLGDSRSINVTPTPATTNSDEGK